MTNDQRARVIRAIAQSKKRMTTLENRRTFDYAQEAARTAEIHFLTQHIERLEKKLAA